MNYPLVRPVGALLSLLIPFSLTVHPTTHQQKQTTIPKEQVMRAVTCDCDMAAFLGSLAQTYDVTIGFETLPQQPRPHLKFQVYEATRNQVFDAIVRAEPEYQWRERDGVIEFLPVAGPSFLDASIGTLKVTNTNWIQSIAFLLALPDVRTSMSAMGITGHSIKPESKLSGRPISLQLTDASMRDALNKITTLSGVHFWVVRQTKGILSIDNLNEGP
ncbi:MAG TPA: hypothetical protein VKB46_19620 [Pyrinomonadaceae bacterium]|nr:hypothetical protein [Pyrinomonadaceae bacterium]